MDHRGLRERLTGSGCTHCGAAVPVDRIAVLADHGDIAFVELDCPSCGSRTVTVVVAADRGSRRPGSARPATAVRPASGAAARPAGAPSFVEADVIAMRRFLAGWEGDLRTLLGDDGRRDPRGPGSTT